MCTVNSYYSYNIFWVNPSGDSTQVSIAGQKYNFHHSQPGIYSCIASNQYNTAQFSVNITWANDVDKRGSPALSNSTAGNDDIREVLRGSSGVGLTPVDTPSDSLTLGVESCGYTFAELLCGVLASHLITLTLCLVFCWMCRCRHMCRCCASSGAAANGAKAAQCAGEGESLSAHEYDTYAPHHPLPVAATTHDQHQLYHAPQPPNHAPQPPNHAPIVPLHVPPFDPIHQPGQESEYSASLNYQQSFKRRSSSTIQPKDLPTGGVYLNDISLRRMDYVIDQL